MATFGVGPNPYDDDKYRVGGTTNYPVLNQSHPNTTRGWECPKCGSVWAPSVQSCNNCSNKTNMQDYPRFGVETKQVDRTAFCSCRKENGGSGICGCILGGLTIT